MVPKFYFNLYDDLTVIDDEGVDLPDVSAARERASKDARHIACTEVLHGHLDLRHRIDVVDESGSVVATVQFKDVLQVDA